MWILKLILVFLMFTGAAYAQCARVRDKPEDFPERYSLSAYGVWVDELSGSSLSKLLESKSFEVFWCKEFVNDVVMYSLNYKGLDSDRGVFGGCGNKVSLSSSVSGLVVVNVKDYRIDGAHHVNTGSVINNESYTGSVIVTYQEGQVSEYYCNHGVWLVRSTD